jgi:anti-anti-sigma factor
MRSAEQEASVDAARHPAAMAGHRGLRLATAPDVESGAGSGSGFGISVLSGRQRTVVRPMGELDLSTAFELESSLDDALADGAPELVIDLRWLDFCDAAGLQVFLRARRSAFANGTMLWIEQPTRIVRRVLEVADLAWLVDSSAAPGDTTVS